MLTHYSLLVHEIRNEGGQYKGQDKNLRKTDMWCVQSAGTPKIYPFVECFITMFRDCYYGSTFLSVVSLVAFAVTYAMLQGVKRIQQTTEREQEEQIFHDRTLSAECSRLTRGASQVSPYF